MLEPRSYLAHVFDDTRVLDLIPWLAGAFALLMACELAHQTVVWLRELKGKRNLPRFRRDTKVPTVATGRADNGDGVR